MPTVLFCFMDKNWYKKSQDFNSWDLTFSSPSRLLSLCSETIFTKFELCREFSRHHKETAMKNLELGQTRFCLLRKCPRSTVIKLQRDSLKH